MGLKFKTGNVVRQVVNPIEGVVSQAQVVGDEVHHLVEWVNADGHATSKWFAEHEIEAAPEEETPVGEVTP